MSKTVPRIAADLSTPPRIGLDVVLRADSPSPLSRYALNKSAKPPRMPRVVTTLRYVTTLGFMAYLTGMRVTGSSAWISSTKRAHLTHSHPSNGRAAPSRNPHTWQRYLTWAVSSSRRDSRIYAFDGTWRTWRDRPWSRVVHLEIYGWLSFCNIRRKWCEDSVRRCTR